MVLTGARPRRCWVQAVAEPNGGNEAQDGARIDASGACECERMIPTRIISCAVVAPTGWFQVPRGEPQGSRCGFRRAIDANWPFRCTQLAFGEIVCRDTSAICVSLGSYRLVGTQTLPRYSTCHRHPRHHNPQTQSSSCSLDAPVLALLDANS